MRHLALVLLAAFLAVGLASQVDARGPTDRLLRGRQDAREPHGGLHGQETHRHDRFYDARAAQKSRGYWVTRISQLGNGIWATDPAYAGKIRTQLYNMGRQ